MGQIGVHSVTELYSTSVLRLRVYGQSHCNFWWLSPCYVCHFLLKHSIKKTFIVSAFSIKCSLSKLYDFKFFCAFDYKSASSNIIQVSVLAEWSRWENWTLWKLASELCKYNIAVLFHRFYINNCRFIHGCAEVVAQNYWVMQNVFGSLLCHKFILIKINSLQ